MFVRSQSKKSGQCRRLWRALLLKLCFPAPPRLKRFFSWGSFEAEETLPEPLLAPPLYTWVRATRVGSAIESSLQTTVATLDELRET